MLINKLSPIFLDLGDLQIRWYAVFILTGALLVYFLCDRQFKKQGLGKDLAENLLIICLPFGILGARIWWCICDSGSPWYNGGAWYEVFTGITSGGLAVQGGVVLGTISGFVYLLAFKKWKLKDVFRVADIIVPRILVAQFFGRWGNFMNQEVYGACVSEEALGWLPTFIKNQMAGDGLTWLEYSNAQYIDYSCYIQCASGTYAQPLFLYEGLANLLGYGIINHLLNRFWTKHRVPGDFVGCYLIWYGIVRVVLEPLRNSQFIMNQLGALPASVLTSIIFIVGGVLLIVGLHIYNYLSNKKEVKND